MPVALAWPPRKEDLARLYVENGLSAAEIAREYGLEYASPKTAETTILYHLKKHGIKRREPANHLSKVTPELADTWVSRYQAGESLNQIAGGSFSPVTVMLHLQKRGVARRGKVEAQIKAVTKHDRTPFDGDKETQAYLIGLAAGDLNTSTHGRGVRLKTATTHPEMVRLLKHLFEPYGHVHVTPRKSELAGYEWNVQADLDSSFRFLLHEPERVPAWVFERDYSSSFIAGFFDAEGSIWLKDRGVPHFEASITNTDRELLSRISTSLECLGVFPRLRIGGTSVWKLDLWRPDDLCRLLSVLPLRHPEKVSKSRIVMSMMNAKEPLERAKFTEDWRALLQVIKKGRDEYVEQARLALHGSQMDGV